MKQSLHKYNSMLLSMELYFYIVEGFSIFPKM